LIKRVVKEIQKNYSQVETFCTLSPIPGFRKWLDTQFNQNLSQSTKHELLLPSEVDGLRKCSETDQEDAILILKGLVADAEWHLKPTVVAVLKPILLRLCSR
jgi:malonyl-CoA decarboxylase